ncbi:MAG: DUF1232 domain-containing protein [Gemmatimonadaceae bacterium]|nr:DUF1232 domain-containing protein [Gemmatimonadaceae bacterium]MDQ3518926.1 YkvA family protein [Gemmatimonadota bacterium]
MSPRATKEPTRRRQAQESVLESETAEVREAPRSGARRTVLDTIKQIPDYLRLLVGLLSDRRVAGIDKLLVAGAIAYIVMPIDFIPDFVPFIGQVDDIYLLVFSLQRLMTNAGAKVLTDHWRGAISELNPTNLRSVLMAAAFFLPPRIRRRLRVIGRA